MTGQQPSRPVVTNVGEGLKYGHYAMLLEEMLTCEATAGALHLTRATVQPGSAPPTHIHTREDEFFIMLSGTIRFWVGAPAVADCEVYDVGPGGIAFGPRGIPHTFETLAAKSEILVGLMPGWAEGFFRSAGGADERDDAKSLALLDQYGIQIVGAPPDLHSNQP